MSRTRLIGVGLILITYTFLFYLEMYLFILTSGQLQLCTRDKEVSNLYDLFSTRHSLHRRAYQHKVVKLIDHMVGEVLVKANDGLLIEGWLWCRRPDLASFLPSRDV